MAEDLPKEYDAIILGTGMTECILAGALSRVGYKVLHLDRNPYYSGDWATFSFKALREWIQQYGQDMLVPQSCDDMSRLLEEGEKLIPLEINGRNIHDPKEKLFIKEKPDTPTGKECLDTIKCVEGRVDVNHTEETGNESSEVPRTGDFTQSAENQSTPDEPILEESKHVELPDIETEQTSDGRESDEGDATDRVEWTLQCMEKQSRKFNIDLMPKILYCRGSMVELLISSDIAKYLEFRTITRVLTMLGDELQKVPCSRSDVFSSKQVNVIEKRMLMKLLTFAMDYEKHPEEYQGFEDKPYLEFLKSKKLSATVLHYALHAIAMVTETTNTMEGLKNSQRFLRSLGRYGNTAFLWPIYGTGDIPQCFCRVCAVFGGTYCLSMTGHSVIVDSENKVQGIINTQGQKLKTKWLVMESSYASKQLRSDFPVRKLSRAILLVDDTALPSKEEHITLLSLPPPEGGTSPITVLELSSLSMSCPKGMHTVQFMCETVKDAETDLSPAIHSLYTCSDGESADMSKPKVLWSLFFNLEDTSTEPLRDDLPQNLYLLSGPDGDLDFELPIKQAKALFTKLCPEDEFLPKAPNPEDIIFDDPTPTGDGFTGDKPVVNTGDHRNTGDAENTGYARDTGDAENSGDAENTGDADDNGDAGNTGGGKDEALQSELQPQNKEKPKQEDDTLEEVKAKNTS